MVIGKSLLCSAGGSEDQASPVSKVLLAHASFPASEAELSLFLGPGPIFGLPCYPDVGFVKNFTQPAFQAEKPCTVKVHAFRLFFIVILAIKQCKGIN